MITLTFPTLPPPTNHAYRIVTIRGHGTLALSPAAKAWKQQAVLLAQTQCNAQSPLMYAGRPAQYLCIDWTFQHPAILRRDWDGCVKLAQDIIARAVGLNDNRVVCGTYAKRRGPECLIVRITSALLEGDDA